MSVIVMLGSWLTLAVCLLTWGCYHREYPQVDFRPPISAKVVEYRIDPGVPEEKKRVIQHCFLEFSRAVHTATDSLFVRLVGESAQVNIEMNLGVQGARLGEWDYSESRITLIPSLEGRQLWLVTFHELLHTLGVPHVDDPTRVMNPKLIMDRVVDPPTYQDIEDLRKVLR